MTASQIAWVCLLWLPPRITKASVNDAIPFRFRATGSSAFLSAAASSTSATFLLSCIDPSFPMNVGRGGPGLVVGGQDDPGCLQQLADPFAADGGDGVERDARGGAACPQGVEPLAVREGVDLAARNDLRLGRQVRAEGE